MKKLIFVTLLFAVAAASGQTKPATPAAKQDTLLSITADQKVIQEKLQFLQIASNLLTVSREHPQTKESELKNAQSLIWYVIEFIQDNAKIVSPVALKKP